MRLAVEDGGAPVLVEADIDLDPPRPFRRRSRSLFDNLLWETRFGQRVLGFEHVIETYKRRRSAATAITCSPSSGVIGSSAAHARSTTRSIGLPTGSGAPSASSASGDEDRHRRHAPNRLHRQAF